VAERRKRYEAEEDEEEYEEEEEEDEEGEDSSGRRRSGPSRRSFRGGRSYGRRPRLCQFCAEKTKYVDYKQLDLLKRFTNEQGKIRPRRETGTCARHQRMLAKAVKRARHIALLPYTVDRAP
jgi:small subunit ribosomal protein S18